MSERDLEVPRSAGVARDRGYSRTLLERLLRDWVGIAAALVLLSCMGMALAAPLIGGRLLRYDPTKPDLDHTFAPPGSRHLLGTDELGRDTLTRLVYGAQVSIGVGLLSVLISSTIGTLVGIAGGFHGGIIDDVLMRLVDLLKGLPAIYVFVFMSILLRPSILTLSFIIAFVGWANVARLVRGETLLIRESEFVTAAASSGATRGRIMVRHVVPHVVPTVLVAGSLGFGQAILIEAALDFLGLGIAPPTPSWGNMLQSAQSYFAYSWILVVAPGALIFITVLAAAVFGSALRDAVDPKLFSLGPAGARSNMV